jgi:virginiamycin B lyase
VTGARGKGSGPRRITRGPDGALWFAERTAKKIGRISTSGVVIEFGPTLGNPDGITLGPDGNLWFTDFSNHITQITTAGVMTNFTVPTPNSGAGALTAGQDGAIWFVESTANKVGRMTTTGTFSEFPIMTPNSASSGILKGPDGNLWILERGANKIAQMNLAGTFLNEFPITTPASGPDGFIVGWDGAIWFAENAGNKIGRMNMTGGVTEYPLPNANSGSTHMARGTDGAHWFIENSANKIGRLTLPPNTSPLVAATLPSSRSVMVGNPATAFATIINIGAAAISCGIAPIVSLPGAFSFQTTDPNTNTLTGTVNTRVNIPGNNGFQTFVIGIVPNAPLSPDDILFGFDCTNVDAVGPIIGVNSLLLTFSATPVPDMIAVGLTPSRDGYSRTGGVNGTGLFVIATSNIGAPAALTARITPSSANIPLTATVCQTDPTAGQCLSPSAPTQTATINQNQNTTWAAFLKANGTIAQDAAHNRVAFEFVDATGVVRGSTSTAITSQ